MQYATVDDLRARYEGAIPVSADALWTQRLADAQLLLATYVPNQDLDAWVAAGRTTAENIKVVLCNMVLRMVRNPSGTATQTAGPFSVTLDVAVASGKLWLTRDDRRLLGLRRGALSVEITDDALPDIGRRRPLRRETFWEWPERSNASVRDDW